MYATDGIVRIADVPLVVESFVILSTSESYIEVRASTSSFKASLLDMEGSTGGGHPYRFGPRWTALSNC